MSKSMTLQRAIKKRTELIEYMKYCLAIDSDCCLLDEDKRMIISSLEKQMPKKPNYPNDYQVRCSICETLVIDGQPYCDECGQVLDWRDKNELSKRNLQKGS